MGHVLTEKGVALTIISTVSYIGEFWNALKDARVLGGPQGNLPGPLSNLYPSYESEEDQIFRSWLVSRDVQFSHTAKFHRFLGTFWDDWQPPYWFAVEISKKYFLSQDNNTRRTVKVRHRLSG